MSTQDPDATLPAQGYGADVTAPVTRPVPQTGGGPGGGPGGPGGGGQGNGDDESDPRRLWFIAGGVLVVGLIIGGLIAVVAGGGDKKETASTSTSSTSTSSSTTSTSIASSTSTTPTTAAPGPQILQYTSSPNFVNCPGSGTITLSWATANTSGVTISIDGPGAYGNYGVTDNQSFPYACPAPATDPQTTTHTYLLTAHGLNGQDVQRQIVVNGIVPPAP